MHSPRPEANSKLLGCRLLLVVTGMVFSPSLELSLVTNALQSIPVIHQKNTVFRKEIVLRFKKAKELRLKVVLSACLRAKPWV